MTDIALKSSSPASPASYEDLKQVPPHLVAELLDGRLVTHPRPAPRHANVSSSLGSKIGSPFHHGDGGPGGWWILDEPELHLGAHVLVPDLAGWRREHMPKLPDTAWFEQPPDWICEVLSPATVRYDRLEKRDIYAAFKVAHLWFVDPDAKTLEAFTLKDGAWVLEATRANDDEIALAPFAEVPFSLASLWAE